MRKFILILLLCPFMASCGTPSKSSLDAEIDRLCAIDGGIKVYEVVILPAMRFDDNGNINIPAKDYLKAQDEYYRDWDVEYISKETPELSRDHFRIFRRSDGRLLGEAIYYGRRGGDLPGPWHESSYTCPRIGSEPSLEKSIFFKGHTK